MTSGDPPLRWLVAFSGGIDSTVLLHALGHCSEQFEQQVIAVHIDHGLQHDSEIWEVHCRQFADDLGVQYLSRKVAVADDAGSGPEAAARQARYAALHQLVQRGDCLLSAHHEDDQAETLLLNLMRGSGLAGMAGIGSVQNFSQGRLLRPMLGIPTIAIEAYAARNKLSWIDDPSNSDTRFDRNFLRKEIVPRLASRWPAVSARLKQSADLAGEGSELLNDLADLDLENIGSPERLSIAGLKDLSTPRQRNVLRRAIRCSGLPPAPATRLYQAVHELIPARQDAQPFVTWPGAELRRYRDYLYVLAQMPAALNAAGGILLPRAEVLELGPGMGALSLHESKTSGIDPQLAVQGLQVRYRQGGEEIRLAGHDCTHKLKKLLQQEGVLPWMRSRLPLLYVNDRLVAVADLWVAADCVSTAGYTVSWQERPVIFA
jgi:tRNA(Ile)-lysidine synthase